jgi:VanZ family protein
VTLRVRLLSWLPVAVWALLIYGSSTSALASPQTSRILIPLLHWLLPGLAPDTLDLIHEFARKSVHFVNYFVLGLLLYRALRGPHKGWQRRWAVLAVLLAFAYAGSDEFHQSFEAGRGPSAMDALLDTAGASAAQVVMWAFLRRGERPAPGEQPRG